MKKINTFIIDDSAVVRQVLSSTLSCDPGLCVSGVAPDPICAWKKMQSQWPDVILLDIEMPRMDGLSFLNQLMSERPTPVVICSTLTEKGAKTSIQALEAGAISIVTKPKSGLKNFLTEESGHILRAIKEAAIARVSPIARKKGSVNDIAAEFAESMSPSSAMAATTDKIVAIGASTGGTRALEAVLTALPRISPGIIVVQHMPEKFTAAFAERLDSICKVAVKEAKDNDRVIPGQVLIAPGGQHTSLKRNGAQYAVSVKSGPPVNRHTPSVDVLFRSVARFAGANALGILMTGMGDDGAAGPDGPAKEP